MFYAFTVDTILELLLLTLIKECWRKSSTWGVYICLCVCVQLSWKLNKLWESQAHELCRKHVKLP